MPFIGIKRTSMPLLCIKLEVEQQQSLLYGAAKTTKKWQKKNELVMAAGILDDYIQNHKRLEPRQVSSIWNALWKVVQKSRKWEQQQCFWIDHRSTLKTMVDQTMCSANQFDGQITATVTHSLVKLLHLTNAKIDHGAADELLSLWNVLLRRTALLLQQSSKKNAGKFNAHSLSNLIWAYAKAADAGIVKVVDGRLLDALTKKALLGINNFNPQDISNTAWAFVKMNHEAPLLFDAIAAAAPVCINNFNPQDISNTAWAFAKMNHEAPLLFDAIARAATVHISNFKPQELANMAWAFATMNHKVPLLFDAIARAATVHISDFNPQNLSNMAWAFAKMNHEAPLLFDAIARAALVHINNFNPQALANMAWAFAMLQHQAPELFDDIAQVAQVRINSYMLQDLSSMALSFAKMNHPVPLLFVAIARAAQVCLMEEFNEQELANTAWSFAVFDIAPNLFIPADSQFAQTVLSRDPSSFICVESIHQLCQLHQFQLWCQEHNTGAARANWFLDELSQQCRKTFVLPTVVAPSPFRNDVIAALRKLADVSRVEVECSTKSGFLLDAIVVYRGSEIGIEVEGQSHFVGRSQSPKGSTILKCRQLRTLERWKLVVIP
jgi:hypothetical protein